MSRHRLEPARRVRPRPGRMAAAGVSLAVTMVALLGGLGVLPLQAHGPGDGVTAASGTPRGSAADGGGSGAGADASGPSVEAPSTSRSQDDRGTVAGALEDVAEPVAGDADPAALPDGSGEGRRVVFSKSGQRVWLVDRKGSVGSTYLVSGSVTDNLAPGTYAVYSRSRWAVGVDDSGVMQYFVRFAHGPRAAIGFHSIPTKNGSPLQTVAQLGKPRSHGCIRQRLADAVRMWDFADVGTTVVVLA
jgi:hypothetical protein